MHTLANLITRALSLSRQRKSIIILLTAALQQKLTNTHTLAPPLHTHTETCRHQSCCKEGDTVQCCLPLCIQSAATHTLVNTHTHTYTLGVTHPDCWVLRPPPRRLSRCLASWPLQRLGTGFCCLLFLQLHTNRMQREGEKKNHTCAATEEEEKQCGLSSPLSFSRSLSLVLSLSLFFFSGYTEEQRQGERQEESSTGLI